MTGRPLRRAWLPVAVAALLAGCATQPRPPDAPLLAPAVLPTNAITVAVAPLDAAPLLVQAPKAPDKAASAGKAVAELGGEVLFQALVAVTGPLVIVPALIGMAVATGMATGSGVPVPAPAPPSPAAVVVESALARLVQAEALAAATAFRLDAALAAAVPAVAIHRAPLDDAGKVSTLQAVRDQGIPALLVVYGPEHRFVAIGGDEGVYVLHVKAQGRLVDSRDGRIVALKGLVAQSPPRTAAAWTRDDGLLARREALLAVTRIVERTVDTLVLGVPVAAPAMRRTCGLAHLAPPMQWGLAEPMVARVESLTPLLAWEPRSEEIPPNATDVRYDVRVWSLADDGVSEPIVERIGLAESTLRLDTPLAPATRHAWSVRARYAADGQPRATRWSGTTLGRPYAGVVDGPYVAVADGRDVTLVPCVNDAANPCGCLDFPTQGSLWSFVTP